MFILNNSTCIYPFCEKDNLFLFFVVFNLLIISARVYKTILHCYKIINNKIFYIMYTYFTCTEQFYTFISHYSHANNIK